MGTSCENLPEAHMIIQAYNALARIAAPALLFKSEAIVHPDEVARYISPDECQLSYNPLLMALLWESLATREVRLLQHSHGRALPHPAGVRVGQLRARARRHRLDLRRRGGVAARDQRLRSPALPQRVLHGQIPRQLRPRVCRSRRTPAPAMRGSPARVRAWPGLEKALREEGPERRSSWQSARILLIHSVILSIGGIPLIYLGDEVGTLNDYRYRRTRRRRRTAAGCTVRSPTGTRSTGAVSRGPWRTASTAALHAADRRCARGRRRLADGAMQVIDPGNGHVFGYVRQSGGGRRAGAVQFQRAGAAGRGQHGARERSELRLSRPGDGTRIWRCKSNSCWRRTSSCGWSQVDGRCIGQFLSGSRAGEEPLLVRCRARDFERL